MLRAMRSANEREVLSSPPGMEASKGRTVTEVAPPTPAPNAASVVRSMFTHGSRRDIMAAEVTACCGAPPASGASSSSATRAHMRRPARNLAIEANWSSVADNRNETWRSAAAAGTPAETSARTYSRPAATA